MKAKNSKDSSFWSRLVCKTLSQASDTVQATARASPHLIKAHISIRYNYQNVYCWTNRTSNWNHIKNQDKNSTFCEVTKDLFIFSKDFTIKSRITAG